MRAPGAFTSARNDAVSGVVVPVAGHKAKPENEGLGSMFAGRELCRERKLLDIASLYQSLMCRLAKSVVKGLSGICDRNVREAGGTV